MEGAPHTAKRTIDVPLGCALPTYIKEGERGRRPGGARHGGSPTWTPSPSRMRPPSFPSLGGGKGEGEGVGEGKGGGAPFPKSIQPPPLSGAHQTLVG